MANEVVKYHNDLNTIPMRNWNSEEMNFFFGILAKLRNQGTKVIQFDRHELEDLANYSDWNLPRFKRIMENLGEHITSIKYYERTSHSFKIMNLFSIFEVNWNDEMTDLSVKVGVTENYEYIVNKLNAEFTAYELEEFTTIRSTYAKTVYRLLKQWRTIGKKEFKIDEFKVLLDTPEYYGPSEIDKNILNPVLRELPVFFKNLKVKKVKANTRGTPVTGYIFTWKPEKTEKWVENKYQKRKPKKETLPDWFGKEYIEKEKEIDTETNDALQKRLEDLRNKRPENK
jgi:plasmid replication initiation protein